MLSKAAARRVNALIVSLCARVEMSSGVVTTDQVEPIARLVDALGPREGGGADAIGFTAPSPAEDEDE